MSKGIVYIMENPSLAGWIKVGKTEREDQTAQERANELSQSTSIPLNFVVYAELHVENCERVESEIHNILENANPKIRAIDSTPAGRKRKKEFFLMRPEQAFSVFESIANLMGIPSSDLKRICKSDDEQELEDIVEDAVEEQISTRKAPIAATTFEMLNIPVGTELTFIRDDNIKVITIDNKNKVQLSDGRIESMSYAAQILDVQFGRADVPKQGPMFWKLNGKTLWDIRGEIQSSAESECRID